MLTGITKDLFLLQEDPLDPLEGIDKDHIPSRKQGPHPNRPIVTDFDFGRIYDALGAILKRAVPFMVLIEICQLIVDINLGSKKR